MRTVADVSTDDLVNSLLNSVTSASSDTSNSTSTTTSTDSASSPSSASASSASYSDTSSSSSTGTPAPKTTSPATISPAATKPSTSSASASSSGSSETATRGANSSSSDNDSSGGGGAALSIGIAIGVLALVVATLLFLRSRRKRAQKSRESASSPPTGATCLTVPADRGFKHERELGMPEMSIELPPGQLGFSKGLDMSYASSARSSAASQPYNPSIASSTDSSVFNTQGGVSPTFSNRKMASYSYQYRASSDGENGANPSLSSQRSNDSTTFHLTGLIGNGNTASNRGGKGDVTRGRKLSAPDEYAELVTATNAHGQMDMDAHSSKNQPQALHADFTKSAASQNGRSLRPDADNHSFLAPLPTRTVPVPVREPSVVRASEESMGPDSPVAGRGKRTGSVYDTIPKLSGEKMTASFIRSSAEDPNAMSTASFLSESSISSTSTRDSVATSARGSAYVSSMPLLQQLSSADDSDYGEDHSSERASTDSTDSGNTTRSGSLIAMNLEAKDGCSEIAI